MIKRRSIAVILLVLLSQAVFVCSALGQAISGQAYETFASYYEDDINFINQNANRHLLPLAIATSKSETGDGRMYYKIFGDVLSMEMRTDPVGGIIEMCQIIIIAPQGMEVGNAVYNDFAISGYHSYALLMAMHTDPDPVQRYELVTTVEQGLSQSSNGSFTTQLGQYSLICTSTNGTVTLTFENTMAAPMNGDVATDGEGGTDATPEGGNESAPIDEGAGMG